MGENKANDGLNSVQEQLRVAEQKLKQTESKLDQLERLNQVLLDNLTEEVHIWRIIKDDREEIKTWELVEANARALKIWNKNKNEVIGKTTDEIFGEGATEHFLPIIKNIVETGKPCKWTEYFEPTQQYLSMTSIAFGDFFISTGRDVTLDFEAENELKVGRELLEYSEKSAKQGSWKYNLANQSWIFSKNWYALFGYEGEITSERLVDIVDPRDKDRVDLAFLKALQGEGPYSIEHRMTDNSGGIRWIKVYAELHYDKVGRPDSLIGVSQDITEEKRERDKLRESQDLLKKTGEIAKIGGWSLTGEFDRVYLTKYSEIIHDLPENYVLSLEEAISFYHPDEREKVAKLVQNGIEKGESFTFEARFISAKGNHIWVRAKGEPEMLNGKCVRLWGVFQDITEQKKETARVEMLTKAMDNAQSGFDIVNHEGKFIYSNKAHARMFGYASPEEVIDQRPENFCVNPEFPKTLIELLRKEGEVSKVLKAKRLDGSEFDLLMYSRLDYDEEGNEVFPTSSLDISENLKQQKEILEHKRKFEKIFKYSSVAKVLADKEGNYLDVNEKMCELLGYSYEELLAMNVSDVLHIELEDGARKYNQFTNRGTEEGVIELKTKDGELKITEYYAKEIADNMFLSTMIDVTEKRKNEQEKINIQKRLNKVTDSIPGIIYQLVFKEDGTIDVPYVNKKSYELLGFSEEQMMNPEYVFSRIHPDDFEETMASIFLANRNGAIWNKEFRFLDNNNKSIWIRGNSIGSIGEDGNIVHYGVMLDITKQKQAENELKISQQQFKGIAESVPGVILRYKLNPDGSDKLLYISNGANQLFGIDPTLLLEDVNILWNIINPEDVQRMRPSIEQSAKMLTPWEFEYRVTDSKGQQKWVGLNGIPLRQKDGSTIWNTVGIDITKRKEAEENLAKINDNLEKLVEERAQKAIQLAKDLELYKLASEHAKTGVWYYDVKTNALKWDAIMYEVYGITENEFSGAYEAWENALHPEDLEQSAKALQETVNNHVDFDVLFRINHRKTGKIRFIKANGKAELDEEGNTIGVYGFNWDVTEETLLAKEREEIINKIQVYQTATNSAQVGVWVHNNITNEATWDDQLLEIYELNRKDFPKAVPFDKWISLVHPDDKERVLAELEKSTKSSKPMDMLYRIVTDRSKTIKYIRGKGDAMLNDQGDIVYTYGTNWDATKEMELADEREKALQQLQDAQYQLVQTEKMASLGVLTAGVAHELNNPLNYVVGGYSAIQAHLQEEGELSREEIQEYLQWIVSGSDRATDIVKSLNLFSRSNDSFEESCDPKSIIADCLLMLQNKHKNRIQIVENYSADSIAILGNNGKLHQVFLNILSNAMDAIEDKGEIRIDVQATGTEVELSFSDTGCGISEVNLNKVMDPFFTTKEPGVGTGLGLSISHFIIEEHKGKLTINSEVGKGTIIKIKLPKYL